MCCRVLQCVAVCVAVRCSVDLTIWTLMVALAPTFRNGRKLGDIHLSVLKCVLQCVAVCCSVLHGVLQCVAVRSVAVCCGAM